MVIKEGKAALLTLFSSVDAYSLADVNVKLHDSGVIEVNGCIDDPGLEVTCHTLNCELIWKFTPIDLPLNPSTKDGSVTPFRRKK